LTSVFAPSRNYLVDPFGEENPENHELAITGEGRGESLAALYQDIRRLMALANPMLPSKIRETFIRDYFIDAMDMELALKVSERTPTSLDDTLCII